jgi:hypothetical protein
MKPKHLADHVVGSPRSVRWLLRAASIAGVALMFVGASRPLTQPSWRQGDLVAIARSFARIDANPLHPRIAWRGTTSGLAESELPLVSWVTGMLWRLVGEQDLLIRALPLLGGLVAAFVFWRLTRRVLLEPGALLATALFGLNPLLIYCATSVQSDVLMLVGVLVAVVGAWRFALDDSARKWLVICALGISLAGLQKLPGLHVGVVVVFLLVRHLGWRRIIRPDVLLIGGISLAGPISWALWARSLYGDTGLSLGISNERHWAGAELFTEPALLRGIVSQEVRYVWVLTALPLGLAGLWLGRRRLVTQVAIVWLVSVGVMLVAAGRTTGDAWAFYYHLPAVAPMALLCGVGFDELARLWTPRSFGAPRWPGLWLAAVAVVVLVPPARSAAGFARPLPASGLFMCAQTFQDDVDQLVGPIVASGGTRFDSGGHPVAYDASYFFQWLDRFGWTIALEDQSVERIEALADQGAVWFVAESEALGQQPGFETALNQRYTVADRCDEARLYRLR